MFCIKLRSSGYSIERKYSIMIYCVYRFSLIYIIISADPPIYVIIVPCIVGTVLVIPVLVIPSILLTYYKCKHTKESKLLIEQITTNYNSVNSLLLVGPRLRQPSVESGTVSFFLFK